MRSLSRLYFFVFTFSLLVIVAPSLGLDRCHDPSVEHDAPGMLTYIAVKPLDACLGLVPIKINRKQQLGRLKGPGAI